MLLYRWQKGRELSSATVNGVTSNYTYNSDGLRTRKVVGSKVYDYYWFGSQLAMMTITEGSSVITMKFYYDDSGRPMILDYNGTKYFYVTNLQGDVVSIVSTSGEIGSYSYDAWGNPISTGSSAILQNNPLRYRGYIYDTETGFYYLQSRYYDPVMCRFINADGYVSTGTGLLGYNMYAYCNNNPVNYIDPTGENGLLIGKSVYELMIFAAILIITAVVLVTVSSEPIVLPEISFPKIETKSEDKEIVPTLPKPPAKDPVHHIVAKADPRAEEARQILRDVGIEPVTDPRNLVELPQSYHASLHTTAYYNYVTERLQIVAGDKEGVEATLASLKAEILARSAAGIRWD